MSILLNIFLSFLLSIPILVGNANWQKEKIDHCHMRQLLQTDGYSYDLGERMEIFTLRGKEILPYLDRIAELRIHIYRDWPYLYEGDLETEKNYLKVYADSEASVLVLAIEGNQAVGIAMGLPTNESMEQIQRVFEKEQSSMENSFYLADIILAKEYRNKKIGLKLLQDFEKSVRDQNKYNEIVMCEILRDFDHPQRPAESRSLDSFWERLGYSIIPNWQISLNWLDIGEEEKMSHLMHFRKKNF